MQSMPVHARAGFYERNISSGFIVSNRVAEGTVRKARLSSFHGFPSKWMARKPKAVRRKLNPIKAMNPHANSNRKESHAFGGVLRGAGAVRMPQAGGEAKEN